MQRHFLQVGLTDAQSAKSNHVLDSRSDLDSLIPSNNSCFVDSKRNSADESKETSTAFDKREQIFCVDKTKNLALEARTNIDIFYDLTINGTLTKLEMHENF